MRIGLRLRAARPGPRCDISAPLSARRRRRVVVFAGAPAIEPDIEFTHSSSSTTVSVFGVQHLGSQPEIGEWILHHRPGVVVVETAATPEQGLAPGNLVTCRDQVPGAAGFFLRVFCQLAAAVEEAGDVAAATAPGSAWDQAAAQFNGEQLAYVAALATGAQLVFGDRPKEVTYARLADPARVGLEQLDAAFSREAADAYWGALADMGVEEAAAQLEARQWGPAPGEDRVWDIMMLEREALMCRVVSDLCVGSLAQAPTDSPPAHIALVVGAAHLPGLFRLWNSHEWQQMVGGEGGDDTPLAASPLLSVPDASALRGSQQPGAGARRGLLEAVLAMSVTSEVLEDLEQRLPAVPPEQEEARAWTREIYSSVRMQLAALPRELLQAVCGSMPGVDMWQELEPLRALRPLRGGPGWDAEVGAALRALNFEFEKPGGAPSLDEDTAMNNSAWMEAEQV